MFIKFSFIKKYINFEIIINKNIWELKMEKFCKSCGMPMDKPEDFANNNPNSNYCYYCGDKDEYYNKKEFS